MSTSGYWEADISGAFGTIAIGRGWGIFDSQAILN